MESSSEAKLRSSKGLINLEHHYFGNIMDVKTATRNNLFEGNKIDYSRSYTQGQSKRVISMSYFSLESLILLLCVTATLLLLPLILPPLPPPPFLLLLVPIFILVLLVILAFTPSNVRRVTYI